ADEDGEVDRPAERAVREGGEGGDDLALGVAPLDGGVEEEDAEAVAALGQAGEEVVIGGAPVGGDEGDVERQRREGEGAVAVEEARGGQGGQGLAPPPFELAEGKGGVDLAHAELQAPAGGVEVDAAAAADLDPVADLLVRRPKEPPDAGEVRLPD